jgi:hypothetical protein
MPTPQPTYGPEHPTQPGTTEQPGKVFGTACMAADDLTSLRRNFPRR